MTDREYTRRDFVMVGAVGAASVLLSGNTPKGADPPMTDRPLGRTGHRVKLFSLGGQATLEQPGTRDESVAIVNRAIDLGVNYIDTAAAYGRGRSQSYIGEVIATRRDEVFLATKTHSWERDESLRLLDDSLERLQTDHVDLWQLHNIRTEEQVDAIFGPGGAIEALQRARDQKMTRFVGLTGHYDPAPLILGLNRFDFDTILMALNPADRHHLSFMDELLPLANRKGLGVIAMKIPARGRLFRESGITSMKDAMTYVLSQSVSTVIVGCDTVAQLEENVSIAASFQPLSAEQAARLERLTGAYADEAAFFRRGAKGWVSPDMDDQLTD